MKLVVDNDGDRPMGDERLQIALAENLLSLLAHDDQHGRLVRSIIRPDLFENEVHRTIVARCLDYWKKHNRAPGKIHTPDLVADILEDPDNKRAPAYRQVLVGMVAQTDGGINAAYVLDQLKTFVRLQGMKKAILESAERIESKQQLAIEEVEEMWDKLLHARHIEFDSGMRLMDYAKVLDYLSNRTAEFSTGVKTLDEANIVPARSAVFLFLAPPGRGKTWFAIQCGRRALRDRKKVLHVSIEMREEIVLGRYYQALFAVPKHKKKINITTLEQDQMDNFRGLGEETTNPAFALSSPNASIELEAHLTPFGARLGNFLIKSFPSRTLTVDKLRGYLDNVELVEKFVPDLLILDYFGVMKTDANNHRITLGRAFEDFRGLIQERNIAAVTPHQLSRKGAESMMAGATHVAEDYSMIGTADTVVVYSATEQERNRNLGRLFVDKAREEQDKFGVLITQSYATGQFSLDSMMMDPAYYGYMKEVQKRESGETEDEDDDDNPEE